jgi:hypothetical protein
MSGPKLVCNVCGWPADKGYGPENRCPVLQCAGSMVAPPADARASADYERPHVEPPPPRARRKRKEVSLQNKSGRLTVRPRGRGLNVRIKERSTGVAIEFDLEDGAGLLDSLTRLLR